MLPGPLTGSNVEKPELAQMPSQMIERALSQRVHGEKRLPEVQPVNLTSVHSALSDTINITMLDALNSFLEDQIAELQTKSSSSSDTSFFNKSEPNKSDLIKALTVLKDAHDNGMIHDKNELNDALSRLKSSSLGKHLQDLIACYPSENNESLFGQIASHFNNKVNQEMSGPV